MSLAPETLETLALTRKVRKFHNKVVDYARKKYDLFRFNPECHFFEVATEDTPWFHYYGYYCIEDGPDIPTCIYHIPFMKQHFKDKIFLEYDDFAHSRSIGNVSTSKKKILLLTVICHEVAHAVNAHLTDGIPEDHGDDWKKIYKTLRKKFVNGHC